jgi:hypothetical protein
LRLFAAAIRPAGIPITRSDEPNSALMMQRPFVQQQSMRRAKAHHGREEERSWLARTLSPAYARSSFSLV